LSAGPQRHRVRDQSLDEPRSRRDTPLVQAQWRGLYEKLKTLVAPFYLITPQPKCPDMVFHRERGLTVGRRFIPSNFRTRKRAGEAPLFAAWMEERGYEIIWLPDTLYFEGEGDAPLRRRCAFCGYKFRTDINSHRAVADLLGCLVISVELVDPRFYHIDTCFCPLPHCGGFFFPDAFDEYGQRAIRDRIPTSSM
jgi:N-dimethylarginine dimethylaminohydrolase